MTGQARFDWRRRCSDEEDDVTMYRSTRYLSRQPLTVRKLDTMCGVANSFLQLPRGGSHSFASTCMREREKKGKQKKRLH